MSDIKTGSERYYGYENDWEETHNEKVNCTQEHGAASYDKRPPLDCTQDGP